MCLIVYILTYIYVHIYRNPLSQIGNITEKTQLNSNTRCKESPKDKKKNRIRRKVKRKNNSMLSGRKYDLAFKSSFVFVRKTCRMLLDILSDSFAFMFYSLYVLIKCIMHFALYLGFGIYI